MTPYRTPATVEPIIPSAPQIHSQTFVTIIAHASIFYDGDKYISTIYYPTFSDPFYYHNNSSIIKINDSDNVPPRLFKSGTEVFKSELLGYIRNQVIDIDGIEKYYIPWHNVNLIKITKEEYVDITFRWEMA